MLWESANSTLSVPPKKSEIIFIVPAAERESEHKRRKKEEREHKGHIKRKEAAVICLQQSP